MMWNYQIVSITLKIPHQIQALLDREGESIGPHSHRRTVASMLYLLEPGEQDPDCEYSGRF